jgi:hypothetical protein
MGVIDVLDHRHPRSVSEGAPSAVADEHARVDRELAFQGLTDRYLECSYRLATVVLESATEAQDACSSGRGAAISEACPRFATCCG